MARISGLCPCCGAGLRPGDASTRAFRCPVCSNWLRIPQAQELLRLFVLILIAGLVVYRLGFRGLPFILAYLVAFWILMPLVSVLMDRVLPLRPVRTVPPWGGLGLSGGSDLRVGPQPNAEKEGQVDSKPGAENPPEEPPPPQA